MCACRRYRSTKRCWPKQVDCGEFPGERGGGEEGRGREGPDSLRCGRSVVEGPPPSSTPAHARACCHTHAGVTHRHALTQAGEGTRAGMGRRRGVPRFEDGQGLRKVSQPHAPRQVQRQEPRAHPCPAHADQRVGAGRLGGEASCPFEHRRADRHRCAHFLTSQNLAPIWLPHCRVKDAQNRLRERAGGGRGRPGRVKLPAF